MMTQDPILPVLKLLESWGLLPTQTPAMSPSQASPEMPRLQPMNQLQQVGPKTDPNWPQPLNQIAPGQSVLNTRKPPPMPEPLLGGQVMPGRVPGTIPPDNPLFPFAEEAPVVQNAPIPGQNAQPAPAPPQPVVPDQMTQMQPPGPVSVAPSQEGDPLSAFLKALSAIQPPPAPEAVRVATPPPPAKPQNEVGNLLKLMLAGGGGPGNPMLSQLLGRG